MSGIAVRALPRATAAVCQGCDNFRAVDGEATPTVVLGHVAATGHTVLVIETKAVEYAGQPAAALAGVGGHS